VKPYRFKIDLRGTPPEEPTDGFVASVVEEKPRPAPRLREMEATPELEAVYRKLVAEVVGAPMGLRPHGDDLRQVFVSGGFRHVLFCPAESPNERVGELRLAPDGGLVRRIYERMGGLSQSLDDLFQVGLSGLDEDEARFAAFPGYELRFVRYSVRSGKLRKVQMGSAAFNPETGSIRIAAF
jgi:hypothetical protein